MIYGDLKNCSNEFKALIYCLQRVDVTQEENPFKQMRQVVNWNQFIKFVRCHKLTPVVYKILNAYNSEQIPSTVLTTLKSHRDQNTLRIMKLTSELVRIARLFQKENLPFISFKGPLLAQRIYGDLTLREPRDLDLLIPEYHLAKAHQLLLQQGYQLYLPKKFPRCLPLFTQYQKDFSYFHSTKHIVLELHWRLFNNQHDFIFPMNQLFDNTETEFLSGLSFTKMPTEIEVLYLLHHGATHSWRRLCWLYDIKQYLDHIVSPNWDILLDTAKQIKSDHSFFEGLALAQQLLNVPLDPVIDKHIQQNKTVKALIKTSYLIMTHSTDPTRLMRFHMLKSRFRLRAWSLSFYKSFFVRLLLRLLKIIPA